MAFVSDHLSDNVYSGFRLTLLNLSSFSAVWYVPFAPAPLQSSTPMGGSSCILSEIAIMAGRHHGFGVPVVSNDAPPSSRFTDLKQVCNFEKILLEEGRLRARSHICEYDANIVCPS